MQVDSVPVLVMHSLICTATAGTSSVPHQISTCEQFTSSAAVKVRGSEVQPPTADTPITFDFFENL